MSGSLKIVSARVPTSKKNVSSSFKFAGDVDTTNLFVSDKSKPQATKILFGDDHVPSSRGGWPSIFPSSESPPEEQKQKPKAADPLASKEREDLLRFSSLIFSSNEVASNSPIVKLYKLAVKRNNTDKNPDEFKNSAEYKQQYSSYQQQLKNFIDEATKYCKQSQGGCKDVDIMFFISNKMERLREQASNDLRTSLQDNMKLNSSKYWDYKVINKAGDDPFDKTGLNPLLKKAVEQLKAENKPSNTLWGRSVGELVSWFNEKLMTDEEAINKAMKIQDDILDQTEADLYNEINEAILKSDFKISYRPLNSAAV